ncbi:MAG: sodium:solute symporter family transporter [Candidatus Cyclobacteriaceae bacterium M3_2C_046]
METFDTIDIIVFVSYAVFIIALGLWVSRTKKGEEKTAQDYFLADRSLTWWAIGASLIAANISAEHFIAMSGSGYAIGLGIAAYEWIAAITLIFVGKYFLPVFIEKGIYTMPQFLEGRFNKYASTAFAVFWLLVYIFVNLTSVSYLGALALQNIMGIPLIYGIIGLVVVAGIYSIYGGLKAVAWTDVIQVVFLIGGGLVTTFIALDAVAGPEGGILRGFEVIFQKATDHFDMVIRKGAVMIPDTINPETGETVTTKDAFQDLPGLAVIFGAMWLTNFGYWGFNQYIIQKGLAAKSLNEAKKGLVFAGYLKILIPLLVIIPGITAYVLMNDFSSQELAGMINVPAQEIDEIRKSDEAYPWLLKYFVPVGVKGLAFAALAAAIVSSLASMINSTSTIFAVDIYKTHINKNANNKQMVRVGRWVAFVGLFIAVLVAQELRTFDQVFQYIQEYTGYIYPGVVVVYFIGLFWKQATPKAALWTAGLTIPIGIAIKLLFPEMPFILRMGYVFILLVFVAAIFSFTEKKRKIPTTVDETKKPVLGYFLLGIGIIFGLLGVFLAGPMSGLAFESVFVTATGFIMVGIIMITNIKMKEMDKDAITVDPAIFKTNMGFNIAAVGIVVIVAVLYILYW